VTRRRQRLTRREALATSPADRELRCLRMLFAREDNASGLAARICVSSSPPWFMFVEALRRLHECGLVEQVEHGKCKLSDQFLSVLEPCLLQAELDKLEYFYSRDRVRRTIRRADELREVLTEEDVVAMSSARLKELRRR
jgi:hypothetical protein